jgi:hypothetical protein
MIRAALLCLSLAGCAGVSHYTVEPFYEPTTGKLVCCRAEAFSGKDISSLTFDLSMVPGSTIEVHFSETGVSASAPITAQSQSVSAVATAVTATANAAAQFSLKP